MKSCSHGMEFITIRHAGSYLERLKGLLFTGSDDLEEDALVLSPCSAVHTFAMRYPIDLAFLDSDGLVLRVVQDVAPWRARIACAGAAAVMERPSGRTGLWPRAGEVVTLSGAAAVIGERYDSLGKGERR